MWDPSSSTRERTHIPDSGSLESQPQDHQRSPMDALISLCETCGSPLHGMHLGKTLSCKNKAHSGSQFDVSQ